MSFDITKVGKGAIPTPQTIKDKQYVLAASAPRTIVWSQPFTVENGFSVTQRDQNGSSSCTSQATCYYCEALEKIENKKDERYSARFIYSQSYAEPDGGAFIWKAMSIPLPDKKGLASATSVPDETSSETIMRDGSLNAKAVIEARGDKYAQIPNPRDIDALAGIVEDYGGFVTGFNGFNGMFAPDGTIADWSHSDWGHSVWVCGYEMRNGKKCLKFKNSWTKFWGDNGYGYFPEEFVKSGMMFDAYVYALIEDIDPNTIPPTPPFTHNFAVDIVMGQTSNEVKMLQKALKLSGTFPATQVETGYYGKVTKDAVVLFMFKYNIGSWTEKYVYPAGRRCGPKIRAKLNELYNK